jgi:hypothetical protein
VHTVTNAARRRIPHGPVLGRAGSVELQVDKETVESSPTLPPSLDAPDSELQEAIRQHYETALRQRPS